MSSKKAATRLGLLSAAWKLLSEGQDASLSDIALEAGVSRQALYLHFGSRAGLFVALVDHVDDTLGLAELLSEVRAVSSPRERLLAAVSVTARYAGRIQAIAMAFSRLSVRDADVKAAYDDRMKQRRRELRGIFTELEACGELHPEWSVDRAADAVWAVGSPEATQQLLVERGWSTEELERWLLHVARSFIRQHRRPRAAKGRSTTRTILSPVRRRSGRYP